MMWRIRESVVGRLNVAAGQLIVSPGCGDNLADLLTRQEATHNTTAEDVFRYRQYWSQWYPLRTDV